jgi:hypothetical protein
MRVEVMPSMNQAAEKALLHPTVLPTHPIPCPVNVAKTVTGWFM